MRPREDTAGSGLLPWAFALALAALCLYWPATGHDFVRFDDSQYVTANPHVTGGLDLKALRWALTSTYASNWHPLTWLSHMLDVSLFGLRPGWHHLSSILLHAANAALLFALLAVMTGARWRSLAAAGIFAFHPLHVESVAWIAERKDVLSTFLGLAAMLAYLGWSRRPGRRRYVALAALYALALMAKPMLVTLPALLLVLDWWPLGRFPAGRRALLAEKVPLLAMAAASSAVTWLAQRAGGAMEMIPRVPFGLRLENAAVSYARYVRLSLAPSGLGILYPHPPGGHPWWRVAGAIILLGAVTVLCLAAARRRPYLATGWAWFTGMLVPVIGLVQVGEQAMADRYTYLPLVGLSLMAVWGAAELAGGPRAGAWARASLAGAVLAALALGARSQLAHWRDGESLMRRALAVSGGTWRTHFNLATVLRAEGRTDEALGHYLQSLRLQTMGRDRGREETHVTLGNLYAAREELEKADHHYREALRLDELLPEAWNGLGVVMAKQGRLPEARVFFEQALRLAPGDPDISENLDRVRAPAPPR